MYFSLAFQTEALGSATLLETMVSKKRGHDEMESSDSILEPNMLSKLRNMWEFANLTQFIFIFGKAVKIDEDLDIEVSCPYHCFDPKLFCGNSQRALRAIADAVTVRAKDLERECLQSESSLVLSEIGLALLKCVSSHRGLT